MEDLEDRVIEADATGDYGDFDDLGELEEAGELLGKLYRDPDRYKKALMPLQKRKLELVKAQNPSEFDAMRTESAAYSFSFPKPRIKEFLDLSNKAGATSEAGVQIEGDVVTVLLPESVATKVRPYFKGDDVTITEAALEPALAAANASS